MHQWKSCIVSPQTNNIKANQLSFKWLVKCKTSCNAHIVFVPWGFCFLAPSAKLISYQLYAVIWHHSNLLYTNVLCFKSSKSILATHWNNFTGGVWLYFQTSLDWLALVPLACVRCIAATFAPPPSSGPHLHQSTRLEDLLIHAINYVRSLFCEFVWLKIFSNSGSKFRFLKKNFFYTLVFTASSQMCR